jgi:hypothetical protein
VSLKKYVPRSIQNIFDRLEAFNESITEKLFSEELVKTFEVIVYCSKNPETKTTVSADSADLSPNVANYNFFKARSLAGHHDFLIQPERARSIDEYERLRNLHFQAVIKKSSGGELPQTGDVWLATQTGANMVSLISFERSGNPQKYKIPEETGPAQQGFTGGNEPTNTVADYSEAQQTEASESIAESDKESIPFSKVDNVIKKFANEFPPPEDSIGGSGIDTATFKTSVESHLSFWKGKIESNTGVEYDMLSNYWTHVGLAKSDWTAGGTPWSAAFISYQLKSYGFKPAASHYMYTEQIINGSSPNWKAYSLSKGNSKISIGDVLVRPRGSGEPKDKPYWYSHGDVVYKIESSVAYLAGGNLGDTAKIASKINLDSNGVAKDTKNYLIILKKIS